MNRASGQQSLRIDDDQPTDPLRPHGPEGRLDGRVLGDGARRPRHNAGDPGDRRIEATSQDPTDEIAVGHDSDRPAVAGAYHEAPDPVLRHAARGMLDRLAPLGEAHFANADSTDGHLAFSPYPAAPDPPTCTVLACGPFSPSSSKKRTWSPTSRLSNRPPSTLFS